MVQHASLQTSVGSLAGAGHICFSYMVAGMRNYSMPAAAVVSVCWHAIKK